MKTLEWQQYIEEQGRVHGKNLFTVAELANAARTSPQALNVELGRLRKKGLIVQYGRGIYGHKDSVTPEQLVPYLDSRAYITSTSAFYRHGLLTQVPMRFTCFTNRRHNRSRERSTPLGPFVFVCVKEPIYRPPSSGVVAPPEQALLDFVYLMRRGGVDPGEIVGFRGLDRIRPSLVKQISRRYPSTVRNQALHILGMNTAESME